MIWFKIHYCLLLIIHLLLCRLFSLIWLNMIGMILSEWISFKSDSVSFGTLQILLRTGERSEEGRTRFSNENSSSSIYFAIILYLLQILFCRFYYFSTERGTQSISHLEVTTYQRTCLLAMSTSIMSTYSFFVSLNINISMCLNARV